MFTRFVEPGRLVRINYGANAGKIATIVDVVDLRRVVIDGPTTGVARQNIPIKWIALTDEVCDIQRGARVKTLKKALAAAKSVENFSKSAWAKKQAAKDAKAAMTDLDRFKVMLARKERSKAVKKSVKK